MARFTKAASRQDVPPGECRTVVVDDKAIALCNVEGTFYALDNACLHMHGPLGEGVLKGRVVTCPWHGWQFDVTTGRTTMDPKLTVSRFEVRVEGDDVLIEV